MKLIRGKNIPSFNLEKEIVENNKIEISDCSLRGSKHKIIFCDEVVDNIKSEKDFDIKNDFELVSNHINKFGYSQVYKHKTKNIKLIMLTSK